MNVLRAGRILAYNSSSPEKLWPLPKVLGFRYCGVRGAEMRSTRLASATPKERPACERPTRSRSSVGVATAARYARSDGQERACRLTTPHSGTWAGQHRSGIQLETGTQSHPAVAMEN
jgi:hypothetical protein